MVNRNKPTPIDCLDKPRSLLCTVNALSRIKEQFGANIIAWDAAAWQNMLSAALRESDPKQLLIITREFLHHEDPALTVDQLGEMVSSIEQLTELSLGIAEAYRKFFKMPDSAQNGAGGAEDPTKAQTQLIPTTSGQ